MTTNQQDVFDAVDQKLTGNEPRKVRIIAELDGEAVVLLVPLGDIAKADSGSGQRHTPGFALRAEFTHSNGKRYELSGEWISVKAV